MMQVSSIKEQILAFIERKGYQIELEVSRLWCIDEINNKWHRIHLAMSLLNDVVICLVSGMLSAKICTPFKILHLALLSFTTWNAKRVLFSIAFFFRKEVRLCFISEKFWVWMKWAVMLFQCSCSTFKTYFMWVQYHFMRATRRRGLQKWVFTNL